MLNNWLYGKKSFKYDMTKQSPLYVRSSLFQSSRRNHIDSNLNFSGNADINEYKSDDISDHKNDGISGNKDLFISPGFAVCVLQHWAYHKRLLPTLQQSLENYNNVIIPHECL